MDRYTVVWGQAVQDDFAERWLRSSSEERRRLTKASDMIDRELAIEPQRFGRALHADPVWRVWSLPGLAPRIAVVYKINAGDRTVSVVQIAHFAD